MHRKLMATLAALMCLGPVRADLPGVTVSDRQKGDTYFIEVNNPQRGELTVTIDLKLENMTSSAGGPVTLVAPPKSVTQATVLRPANANQAYKFNYTYNWMWGTNKAKYNPNQTYLLPYAPGKAYAVLQGHNGRFSHFGEDKFAIDWSMSEGTPVYAARAGKVVLTRDEFSVGKSDPSYKTKANLVFIRHTDGTVGEYLHFSKNSLKVKAGDEVQAGQLLALSGNTGYSSQPHLHFMVFRAVDGKKRESLPIRFLTREGNGLVLEQGKTYTAIKAKPGAFSSD